MWWVGEDHCFGILYSSSLFYFTCFTMHFENLMYIIIIDDHCIAWPLYGFAIVHVLQCLIDRSHGNNMPINLVFVNITSYKSCNIFIWNRRAFVNHVMNKLTQGIEIAGTRTCNLSHKSEFNRPNTVDTYELYNEFS